MKKKILLLLLLCTSFSMVAMDAPEITFEQLPAELQTQIITTGVQQAKTIKEAINLIKEQSVINKAFRQIIKDSATQLIDYLAQKYNRSAYEVAFKLGGLSEQWFRKKGLVKENQEFNEKLFRQLKTNWIQLGNNLVEKGTILGMETKITKWLEEGTDPNFQDESGFTLLMFASRFGHKAKVQLLLKYGANPNMQNIASRTTALIEAVYGKNKDVVELLLKSGANPTIANIDGKTALDDAKEQGSIEIIKILEEAMKKQKEKQ